MTNRDEGAPDSREDAAWQSIVENFGDRAELSEAELDTPEPEPEPGPVLDVPAELAPVWHDEDEHYVPPPPPPVQFTRGPRLVAWFGLFGLPAIVLILTVLHIGLPSPLGFLFVVAFVGSFGYLVATMDSGRRHDGWDDGAAL